MSAPLELPDRGRSVLDAVDGVQRQIDDLVRTVAAQQKTIEAQQALEQLRAAVAGATSHERSSRS